MYQNISEIKSQVKLLMEVAPKNAPSHGKRGEIIDDLIYTAVFTQDAEIRTQADLSLRQIAKSCQIYPSSTHALYKAFAAGSVSGFTVPAINLRTLTYDVARVIFRLMQETQIGCVVFEIARSEMKYTQQSPQEFSLCILAAALREGYRGPIFLQGDHYQVNRENFLFDRVGELNSLKQLILSSLKSQFYNLDIDASTLVDLSLPTTRQQQELNGTVTSELVNFIRVHEPDHTKISIGGEIGHIGGKNSTPQEFTVFMDLLKPKLIKEGINKISLQTGTSHGGVINKKGEIQAMPVDFSLLKEVGQLARDKFALGGAVQHGASTLPLDLFPSFVEAKTLEVHLSTGLQNIIFGHLPTHAYSAIKAWLFTNNQKQSNLELSEEQFLYKIRKNALGPFKQTLWELSEAEKKPILNSIRKYLESIFKSLGCENTLEKVKQIYA